MTLHVQLEPDDRRRFVQAFTAFTQEDRAAFDAAIVEAVNDPRGGTPGLVGLVLGAFEFASWVGANATPLVDQPPDVDSRGPA